jgi:hypothetical protein
MLQKTLVAIGVVTVFSLTSVADATDAPARKAAEATAASPPTTERVEDCSAFYDPYDSRGFGWGSGPGLGVGFGTFEGALPLYPSNSFPNWYGLCVTWGHYSATGSAPR